MITFGQTERKLQQRVAVYRPFPWRYSMPMMTSASVELRQLSAAASFVSAFGNPFWSSVASRRTLRREVRQIVGKAEHLPERYFGRRTARLQELPKHLHQPATKTDQRWPV